MWPQRQTEISAAAEIKANRFQVEKKRTQQAEQSDNGVKQTEKDERLAEEWRNGKPANDLRKKGRRQRNLSEALLVEASHPGNQAGVFVRSCLLLAVTHTHTLQ